MNCKELMSGNFARVTKDVCFKKGTIVEIRGIDADNALPERGLKGSATCVAVDDPYRIQGGVWLEFLEPIPITAEILKANGFMPNDLCDYAEKYVCPVEIKKIPQTILEFTFYEGISADTLFKCWTKPESCDGENSVHICDLKYVHQFQNALRLCGIEKEIKLED